MIIMRFYVYYSSLTYEHLVLNSRMSTCLISSLLTLLIDLVSSYVLRLCMGNVRMHMFVGACACMYMYVCSCYCVDVCVYVYMHIQYWSGTSWCLWAKHLRVQVDSFRLKWLKFSCTHKFQFVTIFNVNMKSSHVPLCHVRVVHSCTLYECWSSNIWVQTLALVWVHQLASERYCMYKCVYVHVVTIMCEIAYTLLLLLHT